jgi:Flp pilus assembly pilin Flp
MRNLIKRLVHDDSGASTAEYSILVAFVAVAASVAIVGYQGGLEALFDALSTQLSTLANSAFTAAP